MAGIHSWRHEPRWARNGQELFYLAPDGALMSVPVERGPLEAGMAIRLFDGHHAEATSQRRQTYDVSPDGQRFLMIKEGGGADQTPPQHRGRPELVRGAEAPRADEVISGVRHALTTPAESSKDQSPSVW